MLEVVAAICGMQAQVMSSVGLAMWARILGLRLADVRDALWKRRRLVKTGAMRAVGSTFCTRRLCALAKSARCLYPPHEAGMVSALRTRTPGTR
jgi:hypothetical protein